MSDSISAWDIRQYGNCRHFLSSAHFPRQTDTQDLKTPLTDFFISWKMTLKCEPSQYGGFLVSLHAHSMTALLFSGVKRRGAMLGALVLWAPSQKGWKRKMYVHIITYRSSNLNHRQCKQKIASGQLTNCFFKAHLFLTVSTCTPGVAFLTRHFDSIGQPCSWDTLAGLQARLNLRETSMTQYTCMNRQ